jgi:hypothetical protein
MNEFGIDNGGYTGLDLAITGLLANAPSVPHFFVSLADLLLFGFESDE